MNFLPNQSQGMGRQITLSVYTSSMHPDFTSKFRYSHNFSNHTKEPGCLGNNKDIFLYTFYLLLSYIQLAHLLLPFNFTILTAVIFRNVTNTISNRAPARAKVNDFCNTSRKEICRSYFISSAQAQRWASQSQTTKSLHREVRKTTPNQ
jgi:hypothetical protein